MTDAKLTLEPCPFCGQPPIHFGSGEGGRGLMIECKTPGCVNPHVSYYDHDAAINAWNRRALSSSPLPDTRVKGLAEDWRDDPAADERWDAGCQFSLDVLCDVLGVDKADVNWDAATETLDGDVASVIGNILRAKFGEDWSPRAALTHPADVRREALEEAAKAAERFTTEPDPYDATKGSMLPKRIAEAIRALNSEPAK